MTRMHPFMADLGQQLRQARIKAGIHVQDVAARMPLSEEVIRKVEAGESTLLVNYCLYAQAIGAVLTVRLPKIPADA